MSFCVSYVETWGFPGGTVVKNLLAMQEMRQSPVVSMGLEDALEEEITTRSNILAQRIPWAEEPGRLQSLGLQRVGQD